MDNKPKIKFHVEDGNIVHSGAGDILPLSEVATMLGEFFEEITSLQEKLDKANERVKELEKELEKRNNWCSPGIPSLEVFRENKILLDECREENKKLREGLKHLKHCSNNILASGFGEISDIDYANLDEAVIEARQILNQLDTE